MTYHQQPTEPFQNFRQLLAEKSPIVTYDWSEHKEASCRWMMQKIAPGSIGVDVGGTEYLCHELAKAGCNITYFDLFPPKSFSPHIEDDMFNIMDHFEERTLDFVTTRHTLEHSLVPLFQLWCYNQLLKNDGRLFVIVPMYHPKWVWFPTHFNCLPFETWAMLFYRAGFKIVRSDMGSWRPKQYAFQEHRFELTVETRHMRLEGHTVSPDSLVANNDRFRVDTKDRLKARLSQFRELTKSPEVPEGSSIWAEKMHELSTLIEADLDVQSTSQMRRETIMKDQHAEALAERAKMAEKLQIATARIEALKARLHLLKWWKISNWRYYPQLITRKIKNRQPDRLN